MLREGDPQAAICRSRGSGRQSIFCSRLIPFAIRGQKNPRRGGNFKNDDKPSTNRWAVQDSNLHRMRSGKALQPTDRHVHHGGECNRTTSSPSNRKERARNRHGWFRVLRSIWGPLSTKRCKCFFLFRRDMCLLRAS